MGVAATVVSTTVAARTARPQPPGMAQPRKVPNWASVLAGKAGNDTYVIGAGDTIVEAAGEGTDTVRASIDYTLGANLENLVLIGTANLNGTGNGLANVLTGNAGDQRAFHKPGLRLGSEMAVA